MGGGGDGGGFNLKSILVLTLGYAKGRQVVEVAAYYDDCQLGEQKATLSLSLKGSLNIDPRGGQREY